MLNESGNEEREDADDQTSHGECQKVEEGRDDPEALSTLADHLGERVR